MGFSSKDSEKPTKEDKKQNWQNLKNHQRFYLIIFHPAHNGREDLNNIWVFKPVRIIMITKSMGSLNSIKFDKTCMYITYSYNNFNKTDTKSYYRCGTKTNFDKVARKLKFDNINKVRGTDLKKVTKEKIKKPNKFKMTDEKNGTTNMQDEEADNPDEKYEKEETESMQDDEEKKENAPTEPEENDENENAHENIEDEDESKTLIISNVGNMQGVNLKNSKELFLFTTRITPNLQNAFFTKKENIVLIFQNKVKKKEFIQNSNLAQIFGANIKIQTTKKVFLFFLRNLPESYDKQFIENLIEQKYRIKTTVEILKDGKRISAKVTTNKPKNLEQTIKKGKMKLGYTNHKLHLPMPKSTEICRKCGKYGHNKKECKSLQPKCTFCTKEHERRNCNERTPICLYCKEQHPSTSVLCPYRKSRRELIRKRMIEKLNDEWNMNLDSSPMKTGLTERFKKIAKKAINKATKDIHTKVEESKKRGIRILNKKPYFVLIDLISQINTNRFSLILITKLHNYHLTRSLQ